MKLTAIAAGLFVGTIFFVIDNPPLQAQELPQADLIESVLTVTVEDPLALPAAAPKPPEPVEHVVLINETLSTIAAVHGTSWQRLYAKNLDISNPNVITVGQKVIIPLTDEVLAERALPVVAPPAPASPGASGSAMDSVASQSQARGSSAGNGYAPGWCTYYAKQRRPDLPNNLGNADTWAARAAAQGIPTGSAPRAGAIGQQGMHVVYIEAVNADGSVTISEVGSGNGIVTSRTAPAGSFQYIY